MLLIPPSIPFHSPDMAVNYSSIILKPQLSKSVPFYKHRLFDVFLMQQLLKDSVCVKRREEKRRNNSLYLYVCIFSNFAGNIRKSSTIYNSKRVKLKSKTWAKQWILPPFCWHELQLRSEARTHWIGLLRKRERIRGLGWGEREGRESKRILFEFGRTG